MGEAALLRGFKFLLPLHLGFNIAHAHHDVGGQVAEPDGLHVHMRGLAVHHHLIGDGESAAVRHRAQQRVFAERRQHALPIGRQHALRDAGAAVVEELVALLHQHQLVVGLHHAEFHVLVVFHVHIVHGEIVLGQRLRDAGKGDAALLRVLKFLPQGDFGIHIAHGEHEMAGVGRVGIVSLHAVIQRLAVKHHAVIQFKPAVALQRAQHRALAQRRADLHPVAQIDRAHQVALAVLKEIEGPGFNGGSLPFLRVEGGVSVGLNVHIIDVFVSVRQRFGDMPVRGGFHARLFLGDFLGHPLVHALHADHDMVAVALGAGGFHGIIPRLSVDHEPVGDGEHIPQAQLFQDEIAAERLREPLLIVRINHQQDIPLGVGEEIRAAALQFQILMPVLGAEFQVVPVIGVNIIEAVEIAVHGGGDALQALLRRVQPDLRRGRGGHPGSLRHLNHPGLDEPLKLTRRQRTGEEVALHDITAHGLEGDHLLFGFHALGDGGHAQVLGNVQDQFQHPDILVLAESVAHEHHVQLQRVDGQMGDHAQRRIPRAEIVHLDLEAVAAQVFHPLHDEVRVVGVGGFRDFQQEFIRRQMMLFQQRQKMIRQFAVEHVHPGHVHRHGDGNAKVLLPLVNLRGGFLPHVMIQLLDHAVFLKQRDERAGADHAQRRVLPANERLRAGQQGLIRADVELRLVIHQELLLFQRLREILHQLLGVQFIFVQLLVVQADRLGVIVAHSVRRQLGPVKAPRDVDGFVRLGIHAHAQAHAAGRAVVGQAAGSVLQNVPAVRAVGAIDHEGVGFPAAHDAAGIPHHLPQAFADAAQHAVGVAFAMALVDHVEVVHVHHNGVHVHPPVALVELLGEMIEKFPVIQPGQRVALGGADNVPILEQLDRADHAGQHHAGLGIRLGNEVDRAEGQAFDLRFLIRGQHDHGQPLGLRVLPQGAQHFLSAHPGHQQIQQHQRKRFNVGFDLLHGLHAVGRENHLKIVFQHQPQQFPVDELIVHHEHLPLAADPTEPVQILRHKSSFPSGLCHSMIWKNINLSKPLPVYHKPPSFDNGFPQFPARKMPVPRD